MSRCVEKIGHSCGTRNGLQVFKKDDGTYDGYCFSCGTYVPSPYEDMPKNYKPQINVKSEEDIQKEIEEISSYPFRALPERKLRKETLEHFGVRVAVSEQDGTTVMAHYYPYHKGKELVSYKVRLVEDKRMWAVGGLKDVDMFGWDQALATGAKKIFLCEGEIDAMSLYQIFKDHVKGTKYEDYLPAVVSIPNGAGGALKTVTANIQKIKKHFKEIVLVFDMDQAGREAADKVVKSVPECLVASLPSKDVNDCLVEGRSKACYNSVVFNASKPKNTRIVSASSLFEEARKEVEWGFSWPYKKLTEITRGIRKGETYYLGAGVLN